AAEDAGHEQDPRLRLAQDEADLALAIDRQDRIAHRADRVDGDGEGGALPPTRQLPGDDVARRHAEPPNSPPDRADALSGLGEGEARRAVDEEELLGRGADALGEQLTYRRGRPLSGPRVQRNARRRRPPIDHGISSLLGYERQRVRGSGAGGQ